MQRESLQQRLAGLDRTRMPRHVAISVDGTGRWGVRHAGRRLAGYPAGIDALPSLMEVAARAGVQVVTLHLFSTENWKRPEDEVAYLMSFFTEAFRAKVPAAVENGYRVRFIGRNGRLPPELVQAMSEVEDLTREGHRLSVYVALNYGGQAEILDAARRIAEDGVSPQELDKMTFSRYLYAPEMPEVDLFVRPGGELRTSNFLPWHMAFAELYFTDVLWPDFSVPDLLDALEAYTRRSRRLGGLEGGERDAPG